MYAFETFMSLLHLGYTAVSPNRYLFSAYNMLWSYKVDIRGAVDVLSLKIGYIHQTCLVTNSRK